MYSSDRVKKFFFLNKFPTFFWLFFYKLIALLFCSLFYIKSWFRVKAWYRNSLVFNAIDPLLSDIDITVFGKRKDIEDINPKLFLKIKKILPLIGEIHFISVEDIPILSQIINPYELDRDPIIKKYFHTRARTTETKSVFYSKIIFNNLSDFKNFPQLKRKKWVSYGAEMKLFSMKSNISVRNHILAYLKKTLQISQSEQDIESAIMEIAQNWADYSQTPPTLLNSLYILYFNKICYLNLLQEANENSRQLLREVLYWEIWGLYSYRFSLPPLNKHFENIQESLIRMNEKSMALEFNNLINRIGLK